MKQKFKRIMAGFLAVLTLFTTILTSGSNAFAASPSANISFWYASSKEHGKVTGFKSGYTGKILYAFIDGHSAYCMNFGLSAKGGQLMTSDSNPNTNLTAMQEKLLAYCMYYGFSSTEAKEPNETEKNQFIATQSMVWIIVEGLYGTDTANQAARDLCACAPDSSAAYSYYESLRDKIDTSYNAKRPSFASSTVAHADTVELKWNETNKRFEKTLTDTNGVLDNFNYSFEGYTVEKNGNNMTISTKNVSTASTTVKFTSKIGAVETNTSCVFWLTGQPGYQEFISEQPQADPISAYVKVKTENIGYGELTKTDKSTGTKLKGAVYGIYSDSACTNEVDRMTTDANGYAKSKALTVGTYYVKEITAPKGYVLSDKVHTLTVNAGQTTGISAVDIEQLGSLTIFKEGEVLTGWDGTAFSYEKRKLSGATFKVTAGTDIFKADGTKVYNSGELVAEGLVTGTDGQVVLTDLHLGTYVVTETKSIDGYSINTIPQTVSIEYKNQNVTVQSESTTILNNRQKANVTVVKKDSVTENPLAGGKYTLYAGCDIRNYDGNIIVAKDTALQTVTTLNDGSAQYTIDLPIKNSFYISEAQAPTNYFRNSNDIYSFEFRVLAEDQALAKFSHTFKNDRTTAKILIEKVDKESGKAVPQGDASLDGAVYGLYAREDIVHPDGVTGVIYKKNDIVATLTTDKNGKCEIDNLYLGKYYVKEISPSEGYLLDEEEHDVICEYEGDSISKVIRNTVSKEQVIKQPFQLIKVSDNGDDTEASLLKGAGFTAYLKSSLSVKKDGSYDFDKAKPVVIGKDGNTTIFTDETGHAVSMPIPYGTYVVIESVTPHNMKTIKPFEVKIKNNNPTEPQVWRVFIDREFTAKLRIIKKDADTKKPVLIPNAEFKIYNLDKKEYVKMVTTYPSKETHTSFFTDKDGDLILPSALKIGNYRIEEVKAPNGYVLNKNYVEVAVDTDIFYEIDPDTSDAIITVEYEDKSVVGEITVEKNGEVLDSFNGGLFDNSNEKGFVYKKENLAGAKFEVYANEDIYTADKQLDENGKRIKHYSKNELIDTLITKDDGKATLKNLPLGSYRVVEVEAPYGYALNKDAQIVNLEYDDDKTSVIHENIVFTNDRQKVQITVVKTDAEAKILLEGAAFGLYAKEDIVNHEGKVITKADELIEIVVSGKDGKSIFVSDLPLGKYYVKEVKAPQGYVKSDKVVDIEASYRGNDMKVIELTAAFDNYPIKVEISKTDITGEKEIAGAKLSVIDSKGDVIESWISEAGKNHMIERLPDGKYILREESAPYGYTIAKDVEFDVKEVAEIQRVSMKDEEVVGKIMIEKKDSDTKKPIAGVEFEIRDKDGKVIEKLITDKNGHAESKELPICIYNNDGSFKEDIHYYVVETKAAEGYILDETVHDVVLQYDDNLQDCVVYTLELTNKPTQPRLPQTGDDFNPWMWAGFGVTLIVLAAVILLKKKRNMM